MNYTSYIRIIALFTIQLLYISAFAQTQQITLLDENSGSAIQEVHFQYGSQSGVSNEEGLISFLVEEGKTMSLSHVSYGEWEWNANTLQEIIKKGVFYKRETGVDMYPITVIAVKPVSHLEDKIHVDYEEKMQHDGAALLQQIPSFSGIRKGGNYGLDPVFRGFKYEQLNIVLGGAQCASAACPNRMDPPTSQMASNMLEKVEIYKGPHALRFGAGLGGTINFVPSKLRFNSDKNLYGRLSSEYQSNGNLIRSEGQLGWANKDYDLSLLAAWSQGSDYKTAKNEKIPASFKRGSFGTNLGFKINRQQQITASAHYNIARNADFPALGMDLRTDDTWMFNARHDYTIQKGALQSWNTVVFGSFVNHFMDNRLKMLNPRMMNAETDASTFNYGARTESIWQFNTGKLFMGADARTEGAKGYRTRTMLMGPMAGHVMKDNAWQNGQITKTAIFGEYHINSKIFKYVFSARLTANVAKVKDADKTFLELHPTPSNTQINPSISLGVTKGLEQDMQLGFYLGRVQRSGSLTEKYINFFPVGQDPYELVGNPDIKAEVNNQADVTWTWNSNKTALSVDVFASYLQNYISSNIDTTLSTRTPMSPGVRRFVNIDKAFKTGFEVNWLQQLGAGLEHQLGLAYTYGQNLSLNEPLPEIAPLDIRYRLKGHYLNGKLRPEITFRQVLSQTRISKEYGENKSAAFSLLDVKIGYKISPLIRCHAGVKNVFNTYYYEHLNRSVRGTKNPIHERGRNFFVALNLNF